MYVISLIASPATLDPALVASLQGAWGAVGDAVWLSPDEAAEFPVATRPGNLAQVQADTLQLPLADAAAMAQPPDVTDRLSLDFLARSQAMPVHEDAQGVDVAMANPEDGYTIQALALALGKPLLLAQHRRELGLKAFQRRLRLGLHGLAKGKLPM